MQYFFSLLIYNKYDADAIRSNKFYEISTNSPVIESWVQQLSFDYVSYISEASSEVKFLADHLHWRKLKGDILWCQSKALSRILHKGNFTDPIKHL